MSAGPFTVHIAAAGIYSGLHRAVLASMPERWRVVETNKATAALVAGSHDQITAAMAADHTAIVLAEPTRLRSTEIDRLLTTERSDIIIVVPLELCPRLAADALTVGTDAENWSIFDSVAQVGQSDHLNRVLLEQLASARLLLGGLEQASVLQRSKRHYVVSAKGPRGTAVTLTASVTSNHKQNISIDLIGATQRLDINLDLRAMADPMMLSRYDANGAVRSWPVHQSGYRLVWADLAAAIVRQSRATWTLRRVQEDLRLVQQLLERGN